MITVWNWLKSIKYFVYSNNFSKMPMFSSCQWGFFYEIFLKLILSRIDTAPKVADGSYDFLTAVEG